MNLDLENICLACIKISKEAGEKILEIYQGEFEIQSKSDNTPLTTADLAAHHHILQSLNRLTPDVPVLSEEAADIAFTTRQQWKTYWLVDPLDGTREFIKHNGEFSVNIALIHKHKSILGVIYAPVTKLTYYAYKDNGAYKMTDNNTAEKISCRYTDLNNLIIAGSRSHRSDQLKEFLSKLNNPLVISMGSSLKSCLVAEGSADLYPRLGLTSEWDTAAAHCIVDEAGGQITKTDMQPLLYNTKDSLLNPEFFVFGKSKINWQDYLKTPTE
ncbi:MAG: 3'(2'),5'-bisphosphate nucleotidase CysQ [Gammaproteobacteria bacterium]|nr:3'(2'),5'-bisphosphate nucleotidase CysQ [Gammaproteobacteria bacterium]